MRSGSRFSSKALVHLLALGMSQPDLTEVERLVLKQGLLQWGGPCSSTDEVAHLIGYASSKEFDSARRVLATAIREGAHLGVDDWQRALVSAELCFASDRHGAGVEWATVSGIGDVETLEALRSLQRKLIAL